MKKSVYIAVLWVIVLACIIFGSAFHFRKVKKDIKKSLNEYDIIFGDDEDDGSYNISKDLSDISSIIIDGKVMEIRILRGTKFLATADYNNKKLKPEIEVSNGVLNIYQKEAKIRRGNNNCNLIIEVPSDVSFKDIGITTNVGEIKITDIKAESMTIESNVGEISIRDTETQKLLATADVGEVSVIVPDTTDNYSIEASTDIGEVEINGRKHKRKFKSDNHAVKKITVKTSVGDINID